MSRLSQLYELQQIDSGLDSRMARARRIDEQMAESEELLAARTLYNQARSILANRQRSLKDISHEAEDTSSRLKSQEKRLYDGTIKNPKELSQVQDEVGHLRSRLKTLEDDVLDAMMAAEEAEPEVGASNEELDRVERAWPWPCE
jgi:hypothetical protein